MLRSQLLALFDLMDESEYRSASYFSKRMDVSLKTIRNYMKELSVELKENGALIESKARCGYRIQVKDRRKFSSFLNQDDDQIPATSTERNLFILNFLLSNDGYVKIDDLCEILFVGRSSVSHSIHMAEKVLNQYGVYLERRPNYGICLVGDEFNKRRLLCYIKQKEKIEKIADSKEDNSASDLLWTAKTILKLLAKYDLHLTEVAFNNFAIYVYVGVERILSKRFVDFSNTSIPLAGIKEQAFVKELSSLFYEHYGITYTQSELDYILLYLTGKQTAGLSVKSDDNFVISEEIDALSLKILKFIDNEYHSNLQDSMDLRLALNQHLVPLEVRMKYGLPLTNPLTEQTKQEYPLAYGMAVHAKTVLCDHYNKDLSKDEVGYLALIFALQLQKQKEQSESTKKANVLIVSNANNSALNLLKYQYENKLSSLIDHVYLSDIIGLKTFDFSKVDYVFTTVPIMVEIPKPIYEIDMFMQDSETKNIEALWKHGNRGLRSCFNPKRFIPVLKADSREDAIYQMCEMIMHQEEVEGDFYESVCQREEGLNVSFENGIALPHPDKICSSYSFAYLAILEKPIDWKNEEVRVVLLASPGKEDDEIRHSFYEVVSRLVLDKKRVDSLIERPTFEHLIDLLEI